MKILKSKVNAWLLFVVACVFLCVQFFNSCTVGNEPSDYKGNFNIYYLQDQEIVFGDLVGKDLSTFKLQDKSWISDRDIEYYDFSSHCIYLKKDKSVVFPEYKTFYTNISWNYKPFIVVAKDKICYAGYFEGNGSMKYNVPKINGITVYYYPKDIIALEVNNYRFAKDMRNNEQVKNALIESNIYRAGISVELNDIKIYSSDTSTIVYTIIIKNNDSDNLYVLDPDKTGSGLFHSYNTGVELLDINTKKLYWSRYKTVTMSESLSYSDIVWSTKLEPGQSIRRTLILKGYEYIPYKNYYCQMTFFGPYRIEKEQRTQKDGMIWIGPTTTIALDITYDKDNNCRINNRNVILE